MKKTLVIAISLCFVLNQNVFANFNPLEVSAQIISSDDTSLDNYVGKYKFKTNDIVPSVEIVKAENSLKANTPDGQSYPLVAVADKKGTFKIEELGATVIFTENESKKIVGMKVEMQDGTLEAVKEN